MEEINILFYKISLQNQLTVNSHEFISHDEMEYFMALF
jgi:hypothetical protein